MIDWTDVQKATSAEMVAGNLVARIGGKAVLIGKLKGMVFNYTAEGLEIAQGLQTVADAKVTAIAKSSKRRAKQLVLDDDDDDDAPDPRQLSLNFEDSVDVGDKLD